MTTTSSLQLIGRAITMAAAVSTAIVFGGEHCFAYVTNTRSYQPPGYFQFTPPAVGADYIDPVFGTTIRRITQAVNRTYSTQVQWITTEYSTMSPFNSDNSKILLVERDRFALYGDRGNRYGSLANVAASSEPRWSLTNPNIFYFHLVESNQLMMYNIETNQQIAVHQFSEYRMINFGGKSEISADGDHLVVVGDFRYVFVYQISTDTKGPVFDAGAANEMHNAYLTPNNNVMISWFTVGTARFNGVELYGPNMAFLRQIAPAEGHMVAARETDGTEVLVYVNAASPQALSNCSNGIEKINLTTLAHTCLLSFDWSLALHVSASDKTGWVYVDTYNPKDIDPVSSSWVRYTNELLALKLDGSEARRLVQHRSRPFNSYNYQPHIAVSRDGTRFVYNSNFGLQSHDAAVYGPEYSDVYMVQLASCEVSVTVPAVTGVANAAGVAPQTALAPGSLAAAFGTGLVDSGASFGPTKFLINGIPAPVFYSSATQVNFQIPWELTDQTIAYMLAIAGCAVSGPVSIPLTPYAPAIFPISSTSTQGAMIITRTGQVAAPNGSIPGLDARPAQRGEYITIYANGLGPVTNQPRTGVPATEDPLSLTATTPTVNIGGAQCGVVFSGLTPGFADLYQLNIEIPPDAPSGDAVPVVINIGGVNSNTVTIAIE
jgi:uncharacterized protein (TIGR03437 family)